MNKKVISAFFISFIFFYLFYGFASGVFLFLPEMEFSQVVEVYLILASAPLLLASVFTYFVYKFGSDEEEAFAIEVAEGASNFAKAATLLKARAFFPVWAALGLYILGLVLTKMDFAIPGVLAIFVGQVWWVSSRRKMHALAGRKKIPLSLETPLRFIVYLVDASSVLITFAALKALSDYAQILDPTRIFLISILASIALVAYWYRVNRLRFELLFGTQVIIVSVWVLLVSIAINYGLDLRQPTKVNTVVFGDCPDADNKFFSNRNEQIDESLGTERFEGCEIFETVESPGLEDKAETLHRAGALGAAWKKTRLLPAAGS